LQLLKLPTAPSRCWSKGSSGARVEKYFRARELLQGDRVALSRHRGHSVEAEALARSLVSDFESYVKLNKKISAKSSACSGHH